jgi:hypothetical protein
MRQPAVFVAICRRGLSLGAWSLLLTRLMCHFS